MGGVAQWNEPSSGPPWVVALVGELAEVPLPAADRSVIEGVLAGIERVRSWLAAREVEAVTRLGALVSWPEKVAADASRRSIREVDRVTERASTIEVAPSFGDALEFGVVTPAHVDVLAVALRRLDGPARDGLLELVPRLAGIAAGSTPDEFARALRRESERLRADGGEDRLARQRRDVRVRTWVDRVSGMWCISGRFDPVTGLRVDGRLHTAVEAMFSGTVPSDAPTDPGERQDHLRGHALLRLLGIAPDGTELGSAGASGGPARPEIVVVVDATPTGDGRAVIDWGLPIEVPDSVLATLGRHVEPRTVVVRDGEIVWAPGTLDCGRERRIANRAQRRALRALYATCAIPGCAVRYDHTDLHHVRWWEHGGTTDLHNLLPLCSRHHHAVHDHGWSLELAADRSLVVTLPDGTIMTTGPPRRQAA